MDRLVRHLRHHTRQGGNAHCLRCRLASDMLLLCEPGRAEPFAPDTAKTLQEWAPLFVFGEQQCAGEAARLLLDALDAEDSNSVAHLVAPSRALAVKRSALAAEHFRVSWTQSRTCSNAVCADAFVQEVDNTGLQLELPPQSVTVLELLENHFEAEHVGDFVCDRCRCSGCEVRKTVRRWPPVLLLHVKRFEVDAFGRSRRITEPLFFEDVLYSEVFNFTYCLQAVAVHDGPFGGGHYWSFVRDSDDQWLLVNDRATPQVVPFEEVQSAEAYLLVFHLVDAPANLEPSA